MIGSMARGTRDRMVATAALLLREHGAAGVTVDAVLDRSGAPRGSVYHHFPGGRIELLEAAVAYAGAAVASAMTDAADDVDPATAVAGFCGYWRRQLLESDFRAGCPVVAVAVEADDRLADAIDLAGEAFERWRQVLAHWLVDAGAEPERSDRLAHTVVAAIEGAVVMCRAERSTAPLDAVTAELVALVQGATPGS